MRRPKQLHNDKPSQKAHQVVGLSVRNETRLFPGFLKSSVTICERIEIITLQAKNRLEVPQNHEYFPSIFLSPWSQCSGGYSPKS
jgi:hypothetical protein